MWKRNKSEPTILTVNVRIRVPPGQAMKRERQLRTQFLERGLIKKDKKLEIISLTDHPDIDPDKDDLLIWRVTGPMNSVMSLSKRLNTFENKARLIVQNKAFKKFGRKVLDHPEDYELLEEMVSNQTSVEVVRES